MVWSDDLFHFLLHHKLTHNNITVRAMNHKDDLIILTHVRHTRKSLRLNEESIQTGTLRLRGRSANTRRDCLFSVKVGTRLKDARV